LRRPWPTRGCCAIGEKFGLNSLVFHFIYILKYQNDRNEILGVVWYGCGTWSIALSDEHKFCGVLKEDVEEHISV
jgi:hypothetical protein